VLSMRNIHDNISNLFFSQHQKENQDFYQFNDNEASVKQNKSSFISFENCKYEENNEDDYSSSYEYLFENIINLASTINRNLCFDYMIKSFVKLDQFDNNKNRKFKKKVFYIYQSQSNKVCMEIVDWIKNKFNSLKTFYVDLADFVKSIIKLQSYNYKQSFFELLLPESLIFPFNRYVSDFLTIRTSTTLSKPFAKILSPRIQSKDSFPRLVISKTQKPTFSKSPIMSRFTYTPGHF
jgi:hypothetical protein